MHVIEVQESDARTEIPSCFEEFTSAQILFIIEQFLILEAGVISISEFKVKVLYFLMGLKYTPKSFQKEKRMLPEELENKHCNIAQLTELLDFLFLKEQKQKKDIITFNFKSVKNLVPEIKLNDEILIGPADALTNISFAEYRYACDQYSDFSKTKNHDALNRLVACLYRKERADYETAKTSLDFDGKRREKFNKHLADEKAKQFDKLAYHIRYAIYLWFRNCTIFLHEGSVTISGNSIDLSKIYDTKGKKDELGHAGTLFRIAEEGTFGPIDKVDDTGLYDILLKLYQIKADFEEYKRKNKIK